MAFIDYECERIGEQTMNKHESGMTLIELLVAITVLTILIGVGVPTYDRLSVSNRLSSQVNELVASVHYARSEAIKRGSPVQLCVANGSHTDCAAGSGNWGQGWVVNSVADTLRLRRHQGASAQDSFVEIGAPVNVGSITFDQNGFTADSRTIRLCGPENDARDARALIVNAVGQVRIASDMNGNGIVEDAAGNDIACS